MYAPLVMLSIFLNMSESVLLAMLIFFTAKWWYGNETFHLSQPWHCAALSYGIFLGIGVLTAGFGTLSPFLAHQPMLAILMAVSVTWLYANAGVWQQEYYALRNDKQTRDEFASKSRKNRAKAALVSLSPEHLDYKLLRDYVNGETLEILADKYCVSQSTLNRKINALTRI